MRELPAAGRSAERARRAQRLPAHSACCRTWCWTSAPPRAKTARTAQRGACVHSAYCLLLGALLDEHTAYEHCLLQHTVLSERAVYEDCTYCLLHDMKLAERAVTSGRPVLCAPPARTTCPACCAPPRSGTACTCCCASPRARTARPASCVPRARTAHLPVARRGRGLYALPCTSRARTAGPACCALRVRLQAPPC